MRQGAIQFGDWSALAVRGADGQKPRLSMSFSGGRTSGVMTKLCIDHLSKDFDITVTFANTGEEDARTLEFVHQCDVQFGFNTVWLEAEVNPERGQGTRHRVVTYETASRNGEPFAAMIAKYGIPNKSFPHCTRELKTNVMGSYLDSIGWKDYFTAIGIRPDESRRVNQKAIAQKIVYPLIDWFWMDKQDVNDWWEDQTFNLQLREHEGNCRWCWKKSEAKHFLLARENREVFTFPATMEALYPRVGPDFAKTPGRQDRVFFRGERSTRDLLALADATADTPARVLEKRIQQDADADAGCSESCEVYPMLNFETEGETE